MSRNYGNQYVSCSLIDEGFADVTPVGGRIEVASEHGKGSTFRFFIQAKTCQTAKRSHSDMSPSLGSGYRTQRPPLKKRNTGRPPTVGPKPHVLIVEDNLINQTVLMRQLKHVGLTCEGEWKRSS
jgi:hypothetical protein